MIDKETRQSGAWLLFDLFMVGVASLNLLWILFDWFYSSEFIQALALDYLPSFYQFYAPIHHDFVRYDLFFVIFFLTELSFRWLIAIINKEYYKWFFYPFIHWYDVLGCIPIGGFRWLRFLRIVVIVVRLQRMKLINLQDWTVTQWMMKYYEIFVEELSDRIVVNVIKEVQAEIKDGHPVGDKIKEKVYDPHKAQLVEMMTERVQRVVKKNYDLHRTTIEDYIRGVVKNSTMSNSELKLVQKLPVVGNVTISTLESAIGDVITDIISKLVEDFVNTNNFKPIENIIDDSIEGISEKGRLELERIVSEILLETLELVKGRIEVQRWKLKYSTDETMDENRPLS